MTDLSTLTARAHDAHTRFQAYADRPDLDEHRFGELEDAAFEARRSLLDQFKALGVDPVALAAVL